MQLVSDTRVANKFVSLFNHVHGSGNGQHIYAVEKFHFEKMLAENKELQTCTNLSLYGAFVDIAVQGLSIDPSRKLAYLYPSDIRRLLESSGFTDVTISGGFDGRGFTQDGQELVVEARRDA